MRVRALFLLATIGLAFLALAAPARAQGPSIAELERLIGQREASIARLEARLGALAARQDSLVAVRRGAESGSARYRAVQNQILENSRLLAPVQRDLRVLYEDVRSLRTELYQRYNAEIATANTRYETLKRAGRTTQNSAEMERLVDRIAEIGAARLRLATELEEGQEALFLPDLVYLPTDGPRDLRSKRAQALDAVALIEERIETTGEALEELVRGIELREKASQLKRDLELWGDDRSGGDRIEQMLNQTPGITRGQGNPFGETAEERLRRLQRRRIELLDRRAEYQRKAEMFENLLREFYR